jgi:hypothetical protein
MITAIKQPVRNSMPYTMRYMPALQAFVLFFQVLALKTHWGDILIWVNCIKEIYLGSKFKSYQAKPI